MKWQLDLNCDMGESFGPWIMGNDDGIMPFITSANIACGFHAGDPATMRQTVASAIRHDVALGAHPGLPDLQGFGRRPMTISPQEVFDLVVVQVGSLAAVAASQGARLHHVKAHGALYNMAAGDIKLATAVADAVKSVDDSLILFALAGSHLVEAGRQAGLKVAQEVFADRSYQDNGLLTPRSQEGAMITEVNHAISQVLQMVKEGSVTSLSGKQVPVQADTLCLHGDQPSAVDFALALRDAFQREGIGLQAV